ncbi:MAG: hypothetical protein C5B60_00135 [Chloroflexi bacterium]|nr:MAG: hypothetical protein C5B60_00135 [Chloroflexota bacterium]
MVVGAFAPGAVLVLFWPPARDGLWWPQSAGNTINIWCSVHLGKGFPGVGNPLKMLKKKGHRPKAMAQYSQGF